MGAGQFYRRRIAWVWASGWCAGVLGGNPWAILAGSLSLPSLGGFQKREPAARVGYVPTRGRSGARAPVLLRSRREKDMADEIILELEDHVTGDLTYFFSFKTGI